MLEGRQAFDGAAALRDRLADLEAVVEAQQRGDLNIPGTEVVLMGHSLGAFTALLASGAQPVPGMEQRCEAALAGLPLTNLSELLQCELAAGRVLEGNAMASPPRAVVGAQQLWRVDLAAPLQPGVADSAVDGGWDA